jgi:hypothetical protein
MREIRHKNIIIELMDSKARNALHFKNQSCFLAIPNNP